MDELLLLQLHMVYAQTHTSLPIKNVVVVIIIIIITITMMTMMTTMIWVPHSGKGKLSPIRGDLPFAYGPKKP